MAGGTEDLIRVLYDLVQDAFTIPFGSDKCVVDRDKVLGLLDEITSTLPDELKQARTIVESRNELMAAAKREADAIRRQAEERARQLVSEEEVLVVARQKANEVVLKAEQKAKEVRRASNEYVDNTMRRTEEAISTALTEMRNARTEFRSAAGAKFPPATKEEKPK